MAEGCHVSKGLSESYMLPIESLSILHLTLSFNEILAT